VFSRSHVCWHVYGLIYRSERNYNEAIKAYKQALRIDKENIQILKDLALLQIQMRDLEGFTQTQHQILELKPNLKVNWLAFALGKHMKGDCKGAIDVIDIFLSTLEQGSPDLQKNFETSELALYKNSILAESGRWNEALDHLIECQEKDIIVDNYSWLKMSGFYQLQLDRFDEAKATFYKLFERGSTEDYNVHTGYMLAILKISGELSKRMMKVKGARALSSLLVLSETQKSILKNEYKNHLLVQYPKSIATMRIIITLLKVESDEWRNEIQFYIQSNLKRGVPSLGDDLSALFLCCRSENENEYYIATDPVEIKDHKVFRGIVNIVDGIINSLEQKSTFPGDKEVQPPSTILWAWFLRSILHEFGAEYREAIHFIDKCLEQTPTGVDLYEVKGRLVRKAGDISAAAACLDKGRELDKQDRYINNLTTKYLLQADKEDEALEKMALFTRHESDPEQNIFDMQVTWYELELAACYGRKKMFGKCLKKYSKFWIPSLRTN
jgi:peptide alpha-N-acetyltransferase